MASQQDGAVFDDLDDDDDRSSQSRDDLEDDPEEEEEEDDDDDDDLRPLSPSVSAAPATSVSSGVPVAVPSSSAVTVAAVPNGADRHRPILALPTTALSPPDPKRQRALVPQYEAVVLPLTQQATPKPQAVDETRRLFQRLWTDEDEIELLQGFLDYTTQRVGGGPHHDTALFYDQIKSKLQLDFNKNQLVEKLRRLKKKYRNVVAKISSGKDFAFKSPHDQATFEISKRIWSSPTAANLDDEDGDVKLLDDHPNHHHRSLSFSSPPTSKKRSRSGARNSTAPSPALAPLLPAPPPPPLGVKIEGNNHEANTENNNTTNNNNNSNHRSSSSGAGGGNLNASGVIEETMRSCLSPLFKELLSGMVWGASPGMFGGGRGSGGLGGLVMNALPLGFGFGGVELGMLADERWRKQQILELEVYSKRLELVQDQIRAQLDELRSIGNGGGGGGGG